MPPDLTEDLSGFWRCMLGTNQDHPRCVALQGAVGTLVSCAIYERRPSPCRDFGIEWQDGAVHVPPGELDRCNHARAAYGLPPLSDRDFAPPIEAPPPVPRRRHADPKRTWRRSR